MDSIQESSSLDFAAIVKANPANISLRFQGQLASKLAENFTSDEEKWYIANLYAYLKFHQTNDYVIDLENVFEMIGFSKKSNAKRILQKNFKVDQDYKINLLSSEQIKPGPKNETILLNIKTFKKLCMLAKTGKGEQIREYYLKMEMILNEMVVAQSKEFEEELAKSQLKIEAKEQDYNQLQEQKKLEKHNLLLREFEKCSAMVYVIKVKSYEDGSYIIKIGESRQGISGRFKEHHVKYEECEILDCFKVRNSKKFEKFLHESLRACRVNNLENHEKEAELFLVGKELSYKQLLDIIDRNIKYYQDDYMENENLRLENENLRLRSNLDQNYDLKEVIETLRMMNTKIDNLEAQVLENKTLIIERTTRVTTNFGEQRPTIGPRLQQINPETLSLVKVYETATDCLKINTKLRRSSIVKADKENTIYNGFRWNFIDRQLDPNVVENLAPTKEVRLQNLGYIAKLDSTKTQILGIYLDRKTASKMNGYQSHSSLDVVVKKAQLSNNNYYVLYDSLTDDVKDSYSVKFPVLYKNGCGKFDSDGNLVQEYASKYHCIKSRSLSEKSLAKALASGMAYESYFYKLLEPKLHC